jgi:protein tyrosine/serine phosphatase
MDLTKIDKALQNIYDLDELENYRSNSPEELQEMYEDLSKEESVYLYRLIQEHFEIGVGDVSLDNLPPEIIKEYLMESEHNNWDGHGEGRPVLISLVHDIKRYYTHSKG